MHPRTQLLILLVDMAWAVAKKNSVNRDHPNPNRNTYNKSAPRRRDVVGGAGGAGGSAEGMRGGCGRRGIVG